MPNPELRQTGRTSRMLRDAYDYFEKTGRRPLIVVATHSEVRVVASTALWLGLPFSPQDIVSTKVFAQNRMNITRFTREDVFIDHWVAELEDTDAIPRSFFQELERMRHG